MQVFHEATLRKTWQTWYFCDEHYQQFMAKQGSGWHCHYYRTNEIAPVVAYMEGPLLVKVKPRVAEWPPLQPAQFILDPKRGDDGITNEGVLYLNLIGMPEMPFEDILYHVNRVIIGQTICYYCLEKDHDICKTRPKCLPGLCSRDIMHDLELYPSHEFYDQYPGFRERPSNEET